MFISRHEASSICGMRSRLQHASTGCKIDQACRCGMWCRLQLQQLPFELCISDPHHHHHHLRRLCQQRQNTIDWDQTLLVGRSTNRKLTIKEGPNKSLRARRRRKRDVKNLNRVYYGHQSSFSVTPSVLPQMRTHRSQSSLGQFYVSPLTYLTHSCY